MSTPQTAERTRLVLLVTDLVGELVAALVNARIYWADHPRVKASTDTLVRQLEEFCKASGDASLCIATAAEYLVFRGRPLLGASLTSSRLVEPLKGRQSGGIEIERGARAEDFAALMEMLGSRPRPGETHETSNQALEQRRCTKIRLLSPFQERGEGAGMEEESLRQTRDLHVPVKIYQSVVDMLQGVTVSVCQGGTIDFAPVQEQAETVLRRLESQEGPLLDLARHEHYDAFTFGHSVRVSVLALNFARQLTEDVDLLLRIGTAALLHDVGKALVPFEVLHSRKPLDNEERAAMNRHAPLGAQVLLDHNEADPLSIAAAFGHHRNADGGGYPVTAHDHRTSMVTRIVQICDIYEALTAFRPYKQPLPPVRAYRILMSMGDKLDRKLLRRFIEVNGVHPAGQVLQLDTGEVARVVRQSGDLCKPVVEILTDLQGHDLPGDERRELDLSAAEWPPEIVRALPDRRGL